MLEVIACNLCKRSGDDRQTGMASATYGGLLCVNQAIYESVAHLGTKRPKAITTPLNSFLLLCESELITFIVNPDHCCQCIRIFASTWQL